MSNDALAFAERVLALLDSARYSSTYKFASMLAIIDLAAETFEPGAHAAVALSGKNVGRRVVELYWPQTEPFGATSSGNPAVLRHSKQADIPFKLARYRQQHSIPAGASVDQARRADPTAWSVLERELIDTVIRMPLAKLQRFTAGSSPGEDRFIYDFGWPDEVRATVIDADGFDDRLMLRPNVGEWLVRLAPLLRPAIQRKWSEFVARQNTDLVDEHQLDEFLFGANRISLQPVRPFLIDQQHGRCFYCSARLVRGAEVDHFLPWSRIPLNLLDNLVAAHRQCNANKSASLAGLDHLERWSDRLQPTSSAYADVDAIAAETQWPRLAVRTLSTARALYLWVPDSTRLWQADDEFEPLDVERCRTLLNA